MARRDKERPHIQRSHGEWYAFGKNTKGGRLLLVPAISFVRRLNKKG